MTYFDAIILGIVEGLTEFLPISSTGHMILADKFMKLPDSEQIKAFEVMIQAGAMFAVIWHYREDLKKILSGLPKKESRSLHVFASISIAFLPAIALGALFAKSIKSHLFGVTPVAWALVIGGVAMIFFERFIKTKGSKRFDQVSRKHSFLIGLAQCLALWPGVSRSMATILGARSIGLSTRQAAEFSFFLAIPTLLAAAAHDAIKLGSAVFATPHDLGILLVGSLVSFITALVVIRGFLKFLTSHSMAIFGWYRIAVGIAFLIFVA